MRPIYLFILFITSCAQQTILTGGDKDVKAPILLIDSNFQNKSFHYKNLTLPFNERVQFLKDKSKALRLFDGVDKYLEHRHFKSINFFETGLVGSYRCDPNADVYIMSYDGEGKEWL